MHATPILLAVAVLGLPFVCRSEPPEGPKTSAKHFDVRGVKEWGGSSTMRVGVVGEVGEASITVTSSDNDPKPGVKHELFPVDLLAQGKLVKNATGANAYRWSDVKEGDTVRVWVMYDDGEQKWYCLTVCVERRPGAKLPQSQDPKKDRRFERESLLNDIDNGEDVSEEEIAKVFPERVDTTTGQVSNPGGLPLDYRTKLSAIRDKKDAEKKEQELKAKPSEKK